LYSIDGVLLRSAAPIPGASESLTYLQNHNIPFILLTNGGGKHEIERVSDISKSLALQKPLTVKNFIQSHTPIADFLHNFPHPSSAAGDGSGLPSDSTILVVGGESDNCRKVAETYGFHNVIAPGDIFVAYPEIWPFSKVFSSYYKSFACPLPRPINPSDPSNSLKIDAIFVFNDPRDWALDLQIILDVMLSNSGIIGTMSTKNGDKNLPNNGFQQDNQPPLYFSNPDLLWAAGWHLPRLGQGGFQYALEGVWKRLTDGAELKSTVMGKPSSLTYAFAEKRLNSYRRDLVRDMLGEEQHSESEIDLPDLKKVYMVGDNPESDIMGANNYNNSPHGTEWISMLVKTGVFKDKSAYDFDGRPELRPKVIVEDVQRAVNWALQDSGWNGEHVE
jgi:HAD superfamily hydrolase (TIGR01456 family)